jgi:hypothetical protein
VEHTSDPISLAPGEIRWRLEAENPQVYVRGRCRRRDNAWTITLFLVNAQEEPEINKDSAWLFQPEIVVRAPDSEPIFVKRQLPPDLSVTDPEDRAMEMLYRRQVEFAVGHGVAVHPTFAEGRWDRAVEIRTEVMPTYEVEQMEPPTADDIPLLGQVLLDMRELAKLEKGDFAEALMPLVEAYGDWITEQETRLDASPPDLVPYRADAEQALDKCQEALERIEAGITLLDNDPQAAQAFRFANRAMHLQRIRSIYARAARQGQEPDMSEIDVPENRSWYPFQLAFQGVRHSKKELNI